jgi:hypothetical protein
MTNPFTAKILLSLSLTILLSFSVVFAQEKQSDIDDAPVLDYETELQRKTSEQSNQKNKISNNRPAIWIGHPPIPEPPIGAGFFLIINHWWLRLPALPVEQSSAIVIGKITNTAAHLSEDKKEIYSEFSVQVEKIFKDTTSSINLTDVVSANREGGTVRFASGRIHKYRIHKKGMPQKGMRYVLFLKQNADSSDYLIITGYKLSNGKVTPLDGEDSQDPRAALVFAKYRGAEESSLLKELRKALGL